MTAGRKKFSSQAAPEILAALRKIAADEERQFQAVLDEASREYIERKEKGQPRWHVIKRGGGTGQGGLVHHSGMAEIRETAGLRQDLIDEGSGG